VIHTGRAFGPTKETLMRLEGKRVLITGTAGGQGEAAQAMFAREGARIVGCDVQAGAAEATAEPLAAAGHDVRGMTVDLADATAAGRWVEEACESLGGIDVLYNNAAGFGFSPFAEMTLDLWRHVMRVELDIIFHTTHPAWNHLCDGGGSVINVSSISALRGVAPLGQVAHGAAKGGVIGFTTSLAAEGAEHGVRVNAIAPGFVASPATAAAVADDNLRNFMVSKHLIQRPGTGEDTAYMAVYLASDESSWVTGQTYSVDGGWSAGFR
jgi:NAD(P)-dependent dehydrogenase (short-subunit alcohol dehydrogenase family)